MRSVRFVVFALPLVLLLPGRPAAQLKEPDKPPAPGTTSSVPSSTFGDDQLLKSVYLPLTGPGLLDFFRKRTAEPSRAQLLPLIKQLGDKTPATREAAFAELISYGTAAVPVLRQAANDLDDAEAGNQAQRILQLLDAQGPAISIAAARLLAVYKPEGSAEALLDFLPFAEDEKVADEIGATLTSVAQRDSKAESALLKALTDSVPIRRAVAAEVLCQLGTVEYRPVVRKLLEDAKPTVRLRTAMALTTAHDADAVPVLISLFVDLPPAQSKQVEEYLLQLAGEWTLAVPQGNDEVSRRLRRKAWLAWWDTMEGTTLLEEFRKRTVSDEEREKILDLIKQLSNENTAVRDKAQVGLKAAGNAALSLVRRAANSPDRAVNQPAQEFLKSLDRSALAPLPTVAARLLALRKPAGAAAALLAYLPCAEDETMVSEVQTALTGVAWRDGKPEPALLQALGDKVALRRSAAAEALCQAAVHEARDEVRKLFKDSDLTVRLKASLALAGHALDREAVPVLIDLLGELTPDQAGMAEEYLHLMAGDKAPKVPLGTDAASRQKCRDAWVAWWKENGPKVELVRIDSQQRLLGYTLIIEQYSQAKRGGRVFEVDSGGRIRWEITGLNTPMDAQVLPGNRVLIAEQGTGRVTERDLKGNVLWEKRVNQVVTAQRLTNGNTFIATNFQLLEVDRSGKEVFTYQRNNGDIIKAQKWPNGHMAFVCWDGTYTRLDASGKVQKTSRINDIPNWGGFADVLPNDHVLFTMQGNNRVIQYDADARVVWEANVQMPITATRIQNGHTLVALQNQGRVVELDRNGKQVWEYKENIRAYRAKRR